MNQKRKPDTTDTKDSNDSKLMDVQDNTNTGLSTWRLIAAAAVIFFLGTAFGFGLEDSNVFDQRRTAVHEDLPTELDYSSVDEVYESLRSKFDGELDEEALLDGLKRGLAQATGDPYTEYLNAEASQEFDDDLSGTFSGIGAELGRDDENIIVVAPLSGFPAEAAGLRSRDVILQVDGQSIAGQSITEVVQKIRGPVGTEVVLTVARDFERLEFTITRETITVASVEFEVLDERYGYLNVTRFGEDTVSLSRQALDAFWQAEVEGIIIDLRTNPGGLLNVSVELSDLWLESGQTVVEERRGDQVVRTLKTRRGSSAPDVPVVVLINEASASASEIVAGALRANGVATIVGMPSFGKGSVQQLDRLGSGGTLKVTVSRWYTPDGLNIDKEGIVPDIEVEMTDEDFQEERDPQLEAAKEALGQ